MNRLFSNKWLLGGVWLALSLLVSVPSHQIALQQLEFSTKENLLEKGMDYTQSLQSKLYEKQNWLASAANRLKIGPVPISEFLKKTIAANDDLLQVEIQDRQGITLERVRKGHEPEMVMAQELKAKNTPLELTRLRAIETFSPAYSQPYQLEGKWVVDWLLPTFSNGETNLVYVFTIDTDFWTPPLSGIALDPSIRVQLLTSKTTPVSLDSALRKVFDMEYVTPIDSQERHLQLRFEPSNNVFRRPLLILSLVFVGSGILVGFVLLSLHTTQLRKDAERALQNLTESVHAQSRIGLLGEVSLSIAHELNQPLTTIANYAAACEIKLKSIQDDSGELKQYLTQIREQTLRASEVVSSVRNFVQKKQNTATELDMGKVIQKLMPILKMMAKDHASKIDFFIDDNCRIYADAILMEQVIINFVQNSFEAMDQTPTHLRAIGIRVFQAGISEVHVVVSDTGSGIPAEIQQRVTDAYFTTKKNGLGIGLSFSRSVVEKFGGRLEFAKNPIGGTIATIRMPNLQMTA